MEWSIQLQSKQGSRGPERGRRWNIWAAARRPNLILVSLGLSFKKVTVCGWRTMVGYMEAGKSTGCGPMLGRRQ